MTMHERIDAAPAQSGDARLPGGVAMGWQQAPGGRAFATPIDVRQDATTKLMVAFFVLLGLTIVVGLWFGRFAKHETVRGYVSTPSGLTRMTAGKGGVVTALSARVGDIVQEGQILLSLEPMQISSGGKTMTDAERQALVRRRQALVDEIARIEQFAASIGKDRQAVEADIGAILASLERQASAVADSISAEEDRARKVEWLVRQGYATRDRLDQHQRILRDLQRQKYDLEVRQAQTKREQSERINAIDGTINSRTSARAQFETELADVEARLDYNRASRRIDVRAPRAGKLVAFPVEVGTVVLDTQFVAAIADPHETGLLVRLSAPSSAVGLLAPGQAVVLKYDAFPFKTFGIQRGVIVTVASAPSDDPELALGALENQSSAGGKMGGTSLPPALEAKFAPRQSYFLVTVKPEHNSVRAYGIERPVQLGSTLTAEIIVERRRLIDWVLDPILAMRGRT